MILFYILPVILFVAGLALVIYVKRKNHDPKIKKKFLLVAVVCSIVSIVCVLVSCYLDNNYLTVYKAGLPFIIMVLAVMQLDKMK